MIRAAHGSHAARDLLLVAHQPFAYSIACERHRWCAEDGAQQAIADALVGFGTFRLAGTRTPIEQFRAWFATVTRNAVTKLAIRLGRGSAAEGADDVLVTAVDNGQPDNGAEYDRTRGIAFRIMPLGARLALISKEAKLPAKQFASSLGLRESGANYHCHQASRAWTAAVEVSQ